MSNMSWVFPISSSYYHWSDPPWKIAINSWCSHQTWCSIVMSVYHRYQSSILDLENHPGTPMETSSLIPSPWVPPAAPARCSPPAAAPASPPPGAAAPRSAAAPALPAAAPARSAAAPWPGPVGGREMGWFLGKILGKWWRHAGEFLWGWEKRWEKGWRNHRSDKFDGFWWEIKVILEELNGISRGWSGVSAPIYGDMGIEPLRTDI